MEITRLCYYTDGKSNRKGNNKDRFAEEKGFPQFGAWIFIHSHSRKVKHLGTDVGK